MIYILIVRTDKKQARACFRTDNFGGDEGDRTPDLCNAIAALSQLSYVPVIELRITDYRLRG
jgi:hypothetical protein